MVLRLFIFLAVVGVLIVGLRFLGGDGLPFDSRDVSQIRFRYSYEDTDQVVVNDYSEVQKIMATLKVEPKGKCLCAHSAEVVFSINGADHAASVCGHCFNLSGQYKGYLTMPAGFLGFMEAYKDSSKLRQPWDGKSAL